MQKQGADIRKYAKTAVSYVNAHAQAEFSKILGFLSDEEMRVFKRGRNAKVNSIPKTPIFRISFRHRTGSSYGISLSKGENERIANLFEIMMGNKMPLDATCSQL